MADNDNSTGVLLGFLGVIVAVGLLFVAFNNDRDETNIDMPDVNVTGPVTPGDQ